MINKSCIYYIKCNINNKKYVGSCDNFQSRKASHLNALKNNNHRNKYLQEDYNKYGKSTFEFIVIEYLPINDKLMVDKENEWMNKLQSYTPIYGLEKGYNIIRACRKGENGRLKTSIKNKGKIVKEETRKKISNSLTGINHPLFGKKRDKKIGEKISKSLKGKEHDRERHEKQSKTKIESEVFKGIKNPNSRINLNQCQEIWNLLQEVTNESQSAKEKRIAKTYNISTKPISDIRKGKHWSTPHIIKEESN